MTSGWIKGTLLAAGLAVSSTAQAAVIVDVLGTSEPWIAVDGGLNSSHFYGQVGGSGPTVVTFAQAGITAGGSWAIRYVDGVTSGFLGAPPSANNNGYVGGIFKDDDPGTTGDHLPSHYLPGDWNADPNAGVFLNALIATFADDNGEIVGDPFSIGTVFFDGTNYSYLFGVSSAPTPLGATRIQLGVNDDIFADNSGALRVCVADSGDSCDRLLAAPGAVPEPATWAMMIAGFGLVGGTLRQRRAQRLGTTVRYA